MPVQLSLRLQSRTFPAAVYASLRPRPAPFPLQATTPDSCGGGPLALLDSAATCVHNSKQHDALLSIFKLCEWSHTACHLLCLMPSVRRCVGQTRSSFTATSVWCPTARRRRHLFFLRSMDVSVVSSSGLLSTVPLRTF